jgi:hypothetical protein
MWFLGYKALLTRGIVNNYNIRLELDTGSSLYET